MNLGVMITLLKLFEGAGLTKRAPKDPTSKAGMRPQCKMGEEAVFDHNKDEWRCQLKFK